MASTTRTVKAKFDGDTTGLARAARDGEKEIDRFNKSVDKKFRKTGDDSGKGFVTNLRKWFSPSALKDLKKSGEFGGTLFGSGLLGAIKTPVLGPAIVATLGAVVSTALPAVGAIAGTGLVAGFGIGLAGLGLTFAAKSDRVKKVWKTDLDEMGSDMQILSRPFESTLVSMADFAKRTFDRFKPELESSFKLLAPTVTTFGDQVSRAFEKLAPAVRPLSEASAAVLQTLGPAMQGALDQTSKGLVKLADSVKKNPDALADTVKGVGDLTGELLGLLTTLNKINGQFENATGGVSAVDAVFGLLSGSTFGLQAALGGGSKALELFTGQSDKATASVKISAETAKLWTQGLNAAQLAAMGIGTSADGTAPKVENLTTTLDRQKAKTDGLIQSMFRLQNLQLGLAGAQISYQAAVDDATASLKANGRTTDINTAAGRANKSALLAVASAANQQTQSMIESNKGLGAATKSASSARANFSTLAQKMGLSKKEADRLAASLIALPPKKSTTVSTPGAKGAKSDVDGLRTSLGNLPKTTTVNVYRNMIETTIDRGLVASGRGRASGGLMFPGRSYLLGERGPEPVTIDQNGRARVTSAEAPKEIASGNQPLIVENHIEIGGEVVRVVRTEIKANDRDTKRRVLAGVRS